MSSPKPPLVPIAVCLGWAAVLAIAVLSGRATRLDIRPPQAPRWVVVTVPPSAPAARDWTHFLACSGLAGDPELMRATLVLNRGGDEAVWRRPDRHDISVRLALAPARGPLGPNAEQIISDAPGAVADCGDTP